MSSFVYKVNHIFIEEEGNLSEQVVIIEEEQSVALETQTIYIDLSLLMNKVVVDGGELTRKCQKMKMRKEKKKLDILQVYRCPLCGKC